MTTRKLALELDELRVETFATEGGTAAGRGTVHGAEASCACDTSECDSIELCRISYPATCGNVPVSYDSGCGEGEGIGYKPGGPSAPIECCV